MPALISDKLPNEFEINSVEQLTHSVCFNCWSIIESTQIELSKMSNTECLLESLVNYQHKLNKIADTECLI